MFFDRLKTGSYAPARSNPVTTNRYCWVTDRFRYCTSVVSADELCHPVQVGQCSPGPNAGAYSLRNESGLPVANWMKSPIAGKSGFLAPNRRNTYRSGLPVGPSGSLPAKRIRTDGVTKTSAVFEGCG